MKKLIAAAVIAVMATAGAASAKVDGSMRWVNDGRGNTSSGGVTLGFSVETNGIFGPIIKAQLTSVSGLPVKIDDFEAAEKALNQSIEKTIGKSKRTSSGLDGSAGVGEGATGGAKIGNETSRDSSIIRKKAMSESRSVGNRTSVDHTLRWFEWFARQNMWFQGQEKTADMALYRAVCAGMTDEDYVKMTWNCSKLATEIIMDDYRNTGGEGIRDSIAAYLFKDKAPAIMPDVQSTAVSGKKDDMPLVKYTALTSVPDYGVKRWTIGFQETVSNPEAALKNLEADRASLKLMLQPNSTAKTLDAKGHKAEAVAKYAADAVIKWEKPEFTGITSIEDKYLAALAISKREDSDLGKQYAAAVQANDPNLNLVTVKRSYSGILSVLAAMAALAGAIVWFIKKGKFNVKETNHVNQ